MSIASLDARFASIEKPRAFPTPLEIAAILLGVQAFWFLVNNPLRMGLGLLAVMAALAANRFLLGLASAHGPRIQFRWIIALAFLLFTVDLFVAIPTTLVLVFSIVLSAVLAISGKVSLLAASLVGLGVILVLEQVTNVRPAEYAFGPTVLVLVLSWAGLRLSLQSSATRRIWAAMESGVRTTGVGATALFSVPGVRLLLGLVCVWALMSLSGSV